MIAYKEAPVNSKSDTLSLQRRWANATRAQVDAFMDRVRQRPNDHPEYTVAGNTLYHTHGRLGRKEIVPLESREQTMAGALERYSYPGLQRFQQQLANEYVNLSRRKVARWYNNSELVQLHRTAPSTRMVRRPVHASRGLSLLQIDLLDMRSTVSRGQRWVLVCVDVFSRLIMVRTMPNKRAVTVARAFESIIRAYSLDLFQPNIIADNDKSFEAEFDQLLQRYDLKMIHVKTYTHGAAIVEAANKLIRARLGRFMTRTGRRDWAHPDGLDAVVHQLNSTPHHNTKVPPAVALHAFLNGDNQMVEYVVERQKRAAAKSLSREQPRLAVGQAVRLSIYAISSAARKQRSHMTKGRKASQLASWTRAIFHVSHVSAGTVLSHAIYRVTELPRKRFFRNELAPLSEDELRGDAAPPRPKDRMNNLERRALDRLIEQNEADGGEKEPNRFVGTAVVRRPFLDREEPQVGRVVGHIPPSREVLADRALDYDDDPSNDFEDDDGNFGERYVIEYEGGYQEQMTPDELMMYLSAEDTEAYAREGEGDEAKTDSSDDDAQPVRKLTALERRYLGMIVEADPDNDSDVGTVIKVNKKSVWIRWKEPFDTADDGTPNFIQRNKPMAEIKQYEKDYGLAKDDDFLNSLNIQQA